MDRGQIGPCKTPMFWRPSATRKTTHFGVRDAKCNAAGAMHRVAWALQTAKGTGQKCKKPWENQGFGAERTGFEPAEGCYPFADLANRCFRPLSHLSGCGSRDGQCVGQAPSSLSQFPNNWATRQVRFAAWARKTLATRHPRRLLRYDDFKPVCWK